MLRIKSFCFLIVAGFLMLSSPSFALMGFGLHYGFDMTLKMNDNFSDPANFDNLKLNMTGLGTLPAAYTSATTIPSNLLPINISRSAWENSGLNGGVKLYVDVIPFIDAVELSSNFGVWQYNGVLRYPKSIAFSDNQSADPNTPFTDRVKIEEDSTALTLENTGKSFAGIKKTPYAKLHVDLTIRKYIFQFPPLLKTVKIYGGGGMNVDFATPVLSGHLIQDALGDELNKTISYTEMNTLFADPQTGKKIVTKILDEMMTPHWGCHLALGTMVKIPLIPLGIYVDGKYIIPFEKLDKYVDIGGMGLLVNCGLALAF